MISLQEATNNLRLRIPKHVLDIHKAFKREGKKLYIVGGAVRDAILGKRPKDFDLATDAKPEEVLKIAKKYGFNSNEVGKAFGVVVVNGEEIATFRKDIGKGRRPDSVDYTDIQGDVKRRDLTINALFYDIERKEIVDLVGGVKDLKDKNIRTVGKAEERFDEDPLRKLRVLRFAGRIGGKIESATREALEGNPDISGVSPERIQDEFVKAIQTSKSTKWYLKTADDIKILQQIFPRMNYSRDFIDENNYKLLISWLFRKKKAQDIYSYLKKLKYSHEESYDIKFLIYLTNFKPEYVFRLKKLQENTSLSDKEILQWGKMVGKDLKKFIRFNLSVSGHDVMSMGFKGKEIGKQIEKMEKEKFLNEASYAGNLGFEEMMKFYDMASSKQIKALEKLIDRGRESLAWKLVQKVTGTKLKGKEFEAILKEYPTIDGRHSNRADDWGGLRDDDEMDLQELAMGYPGKEDIEELEKELKRLRTKFNKEKKERNYGKSYANSHLKEASIANTLGNGNNSARWTAPGQSRKLNIPQLSGYHQVVFPEADELDISDEEFGWEGISNSKKYHNKRIAVRNANGEVVFEGRVKDLKRILKETKGKKFNLKEAPFPVTKGYEFTPTKNFKQIRKGNQYVVDDIKGSPGNFTILVKEKGGYNTFRVKARSLEEFYSKIMTVREMNDLKHRLIINETYNESVIDWEAILESTKYDNREVVVKNPNGEVLFEGTVKEMKKYKVSEGGAATDGDPIPAECSLPMYKDVVKQSVKKLNIKPRDMRPLGSTGKKPKGEYCGDIDIAVDGFKVASENDLKFNEVQDFIFNKVSPMFDNVVNNKGTGVISFLYPIPNSQMKGQVDFMIVEDVDYAEWYYSSPNFTKNESKYKGLYANLFLVNIAKNVDTKDAEEYFEDEYEGKYRGELKQFTKFGMSPKNGLIKQLKSFKGKTKRVSRPKTVKDATKQISKAPEEILNFLLGTDPNKRIPKTFESFYKQFQSSDFPYPRKRKTIEKDFKQDIKRLGFPIPSEMN